MFFHRADDLDRLLGRLPSHIAIDTKFHIRPDRLADQLHSRDVTRRVLASDFYLDGAVSPFDPLAGQLSHVFGWPEGDRIAEGNAVSDLAAEQVIDRCIECFPDDIPQRHLDAGFCLLHAIEGAIHFLHDPRNAKRVFTDDRGNQRGREIMMQQRAAPLEHAVDLAKPDNVGIGFHEDNCVIRVCRRSERRLRDTSESALSGTENRHAANIRDFHEEYSIGLTVPNSLSFHEQTVHADGFECN